MKLTMWKALARRISTLLLAGFLAVVLVRFAPGFGTDERELDARLDAASLQKIRQAAGGEENVLAFYLKFLRKAALGDLGYSRTFDRPLRELLIERLPVTLRSVGFGWLSGLAAGFLLAGALTLSARPAFEVVGAVFGGALICLPASLIGLLLYYAGLPVAAGIAVIVFPKVFSYAEFLLKDGLDLPHVVASRARGQKLIRILFLDIALPLRSTLLALIGVTITAAMGAAIPMEVVCDSPGIGQLAWRAAQGRDLVLLTGLTLVLAVVTLTANSLADLASGEFEAAAE